MADDDPNLADDGTETGRNARAIRSQYENEDTDKKAQAPYKAADPNEPTVRRAEPATPADKLQQSEEDAMGMYQRFIKEAAAADEARGKNKQWIDQKMQELLSRPEPQMPSFEEIYGQQSPPPDQQKNLQQYGTSLASFAAIALPLLFSFRRGSAAQAGAMHGFAEAVNGIKNGYEERAGQGMAMWKAQNDMRRQMGTERMNYFKEVIANRRIDRQEKMELLKSVADYYGDDATAKHAEANDYKGLIDHLDKQEKLERAREKDIKDHEGKKFEFAKSKDQEEYISRLLQKFPDLRKGLQSPQGTDEFWKAYDEGMKRYPFASFQQDVEAEKKQRYQDIHPPKPPKSGSKPTNKDPLNLGLSHDQKEDDSGSGVTGGY